MAGPLDVQFAPLSRAPSGTLILLAGEELALGPAARALFPGSDGLLYRLTFDNGPDDNSGRERPAPAPAGLLRLPGFPPRARRPIATHSR